MILTDCYIFKKFSGQKSKTRIDCIASTGSYDVLESMRNKEGRLYLYIGDNAYTKSVRERKADLALSKSSHISSIYTPDVSLPYCYGDFNHTEDTVLFVFKDAAFINGAIQPGAEIGIFIARGQRQNRIALYNLLCDGELDEEILQLRANAVAESEPDNHD